MFVREALDAGALAYVLKNQPLSEVLEAFSLAARGLRYLAPRLSLDGQKESGAPSEADSAPGGVLGRLSKREREVFNQILRGAANSREIARSLCISLKTVETHRSHVNRKLDVHSPAELIRVAALAGLLRTDRLLPLQS